MRRAAIAFSAATFAISLAALLGWITGHRLLASIRPDYIPMAHSSAIILIFLSLSVIIHLIFPRFKWFSTSFAILSLFAVVPLILDFVTFYHFNFEQMIFNVEGRLFGVPVGKASPITLIILMFESLSILSLVLFTNKKNYVSSFAVTFALAAGAVSSITIMSYLFGTPLLYGYPLIPVALTTAVGMLFLSAGIIFAAGEEYWPVSLFMGDSPKAILLRFFIPLVVLSIFFIEWIEAIVKPAILPVFVHTAVVELFTVIATFIVVLLASRIVGNKIEGARKAREDELLRLSAAKDEFLSTVSHELKTPLSLVKEGLCQLLEGLRGPLTQEQIKHIELIKKNSGRLEHIIKNLLDMSAIEYGKLKLKREWVDLTDIIRGLADICCKEKAAGKGLDLRITFPQGGAKAFVDREAISEIMTNLVGNAVKFTERGFVEISVNENDDGITVSVADSGPGISSDNQKLVFKKFVQFERHPGAGEKGTGLGLAIVQKLVEAHGGKIWVESVLGQGSKFSFFIPKNT